MENESINELLGKHRLNVESQASTESATVAATDYNCKLSYRVRGGKVTGTVMRLFVNSREVAQVIRDETTGDQEIPINITQYIVAGQFNEVRLWQGNINFGPVESRSEFSLRKGSQMLVKESYDSDGALFRETDDKWTI